MINYLCTNFDDDKVVYTVDPIEFANLVLQQKKIFLQNIKKKYDKFKIERGYLSKFKCYKSFQETRF